MLKAEGNSKFPIVELAGNLNIRKKQGNEKFPMGGRGGTVTFGLTLTSIALGILYDHQQIDETKLLILRNT